MHGIGVQAALAVGPDQQQNPRGPARARVGHRETADRAGGLGGQPIEQPGDRAAVDLGGLDHRRRRRLHEARDVAARKGMTLRAIIEQGLRRVIDEANQPRPFKLRQASFGGTGLQAEFKDASWEELRDAIYRGCGT